mgnify:CR=1 FL=1
MVIIILCTVLDESKGLDVYGGYKEMVQMLIYIVIYKMKVKSLQLHIKETATIV